VIYLCISPLKRFFFNKFVAFVIFLNTQMYLFVLKTDVEKITSTNKKTLHLIFTHCIMLTSSCPIDSYLMKKCDFLPALNFWHICYGQLLAERCNFIRMSGCCHDMLSVCHLSSVCLWRRLTRMYYDNRIEVRITRFSQKSNTRSQLFQNATFDGEIWRGFLILGLKLWWVVFDFAMLYLGNGVIDLSWQLIANR